MPVEQTTRSDSVGQGRGLIDRLNDKADQCRNDGADDIAQLLDEASAALSAARVIIKVEVEHLLSCCTLDGDRETLDEGAKPVVERMDAALALIDQGAAA